MKIKYRPEIDGLRALSIISVIIYHAQIKVNNFQLLKGGFIGVDIFFVISGYLITSIILQELSIDKFSFKKFYLRRIRRIIPALIFIIIIFLPFGWFYLIPGAFTDFSKSIIYSLGFSSNIYFYISGQEYAATNALLKPLLHTWSLAVEEQFYILFPIFFYFVYKYFKKYLFILLILSLIVSLSLANSEIINTSLNFYILPTRSWELLSGSILAYFQIKYGRLNTDKKIYKIFPSLGLLSILFSFFYFDNTTPHPSIITMVPIIGSCLIIWFSNNNEIVTRILSFKVFVFIGLISYSLYLTHYPVFAFARIQNIYDNHWFTPLLLIFIVITLSLISYYFIEKPFRQK